MENNAPVLDEPRPSVEPVVRPPASRPIPDEQRPAQLPQARPKRRVRKFFARLAVLLAVVLATSQLTAVAYIWITPPNTAYMQQEGGPIVYQYVSLDHISRYMVAATIAHEDQELGARPGGFDIEEFIARAKAYSEGQPDPSGSTIPQQLVKNIFLWPDQSAFRKGLEAGLATQFSYTLSDQRILELYLNYAQFGPKLYGVCAAAWYYYNTPPWDMTEYQAAQLMGVVPFPSIVQRAPEGGAFVGKATHPKTWDNLNGAANVWVPRQVEGMGGWQAAVATIGITDTAADHADKRSNQDACSTMPQDVADRINVESGN